MWRAFVLLFAFCSLLMGCSSDVDNNQTADNTKYLAKNIVFSSENSDIEISKNKNSSGIFSFDFVQKSYAQSDDIDTETKLLAENVIFETSSNSQIESDNVQDALEEISLKLSNVMVGTWNIQNYNQEEYHGATGKITINNDGTYHLINGSFAAIGQGSGEGADGMCDYNDGSQTYKIYGEELAAFTFSETDSVIPRLVKLRPNQITFVGSGGCGKVGRQRISILTRDTE